MYIIYCCLREQHKANRDAPVAELADAQRSGRCMGNHVQVRILFGALYFRTLGVLSYRRFFYFVIIAKNIVMSICGVIIMKQPKMTDVAKLAGVSPTTVSRVINWRGYLSNKTINKVEDAMRQLNYRPNVIAKQLQSQQTKVIGILVPSVANPFFGELTYQLERAFFNAGFKVLIGNAENDVK